MLPYKDENPTILTPYVTVGIIAVTGVVWLLFQRAGAEPGLSQSVRVHTHRRPPWYR